MNETRDVEILDELLVELTGFGVRVSDVFMNNRF